MVHLFFAVVVTGHFVVCCVLLVELLRETWLDSDVVVVPVVCTGPSAVAVESGELHFIPYATPRAVHTMPQPRGVQ